VTTYNQKRQPVKVVKAAPAQAHKITSQKGILVTSIDGKTAPEKSQRAISQLMAPHHLPGHHTRTTD
jgi:hypothetical protein